MLIIKTAEDRERCTSCYGNIIVELTMEEVVALFSGATLGDPNFNEYGVVQIVKEKIENKYQIEGKKSFGTFFCNGQSIELQPDLVISDKNRPLLIIDAKYKNEWENVASNKSDKPEREDCFQIMSYMYRAECKFGMIFSL